MSSPVNGDAPDSLRSELLPRLRTCYRSGGHLYCIRKGHSSVATTTVAFHWIGFVLREHGVSVASRHSAPQPGGGRARRSPPGTNSTSTLSRRTRAGKRPHSQAARTRGATERRGGEPTQFGMLRKRQAVRSQDADLGEVGKIHMLQQVDQICLPAPAARRKSADQHPCPGPGRLVEHTPIGRHAFRTVPQALAAGVGSPNRPAIRHHGHERTELKFDARCGFA